MSYTSMAAWTEIPGQLAQSILENDMDIPEILAEWYPPLSNEHLSVIPGLLAGLALHLPCTAGLLNFY